MELKKLIELAKKALEMDGVVDLNRQVVMKKGEVIQERKPGNAGNISINIENPYLPSARLRHDSGGVRNQIITLAKQN
jgi:hypothetical protein